MSPVDVAVKILTDVGSAGSRLSNAEANHSAATWDKVRLEKLLHEVRGGAGNGDRFMQMVRGAEE